MPSLRRYKTSDEGLTPVCRLEKVKMACQTCPQHLWRPHNRKNCTAGLEAGSQRPKIQMHRNVSHRSHLFHHFTATREPQGGFPIIGHGVGTDLQPSASRSWPLCDDRRSDGRHSGSELQFGCILASPVTGGCVSPPEDGRRDPDRLQSWPQPTRRCINRLSAMGTNWAACRVSWR